MVKQRQSAKGRKARAAVADIEKSIDDAATMETLASRDDLFSEDTQGTLKGLSKSVRKAIKYDPMGTNRKPLTQSELAKVAKAARSRPMPKKKDETEGLDLWGVEPAKPKLAFDKVRRIEVENASGRGSRRAAAISKSPAVMPPMAGHSANPAKEDLETLYGVAASVEIAKDREAEIHQRHQRPMTAVLKDNFDAEELDQMTEAEKAQAFLKLTRGEITETPVELPGTQSAKKRKTRTQRNQQMRGKAVNAALTKEQRQKKLDKSIGELGPIAKSLKQEQKDRTAKQDFVKQIKAQEETEVVNGMRNKTKKVGRHAFEESAVEIVFDAEERQSLRVAPKVSAVKTCVDSLFRRNLLEAPPPNSSRTKNHVKSLVRKATVRRKYVAKELRDGIL